MESCLLQSTYVIINKLFSRKITGAIDPTSSTEPLSWDIAGPSLLFLIADIFVYWIILILIEYGFFKRIFGRRGDA